MIQHIFIKEPTNKIASCYYCRKKLSGRLPKIGMPTLFKVPNNKHNIVIRKDVYLCSRCFNVERKAVIARLNSTWECYEQMMNSDKYKTIAINEAVIEEL